MRATAASRHVARTYSGKSDVIIQHYKLTRAYHFSVFSSTLHIFKDRNKVADRSEKLIYDDSMHEMAPCCYWPNTDLKFFEQASANEA